MQTTSLAAPSRHRVTSDYILSKNCLIVNLSVEIFLQLGVEWRRAATIWILIENKKSSALFPSFCKLYFSASKALHYSYLSRLSQRESLTTNSLTEGSSLIN